MLHIIYSSQWVLVNIQLISSSSLLHCTVYCRFVDSAPFTNCARVWVSLIVVVNVVYASYYMFQHIVALCCFTSASLQIMNGSDLLLLLIFCYLLRSSPPLPVLSSPHTYEWHLHMFVHTHSRSSLCSSHSHNAKMSNVRSRLRDRRHHKSQQWNNIVRGTSRWRTGISQAPKTHQKSRDREMSINRSTGTAYTSKKTKEKKLKTMPYVLREPTCPQL